MLAGLIADQPRAVLDIGAGNGALARPLAAIVDRVHAVDYSAAMIEEGRRLPGGASPNLTWALAPAEVATLDPPYALVTAGASLHWMDWRVVLPRLHEVLTARGLLAIVDQQAPDPPWKTGLVELILRYTTNPEFRPDYDFVAALEEQGLLEQRGRIRTLPVLFRQPVDAYVEQWHSRASLARERMTPESASAFDAQIRDLVTPYADKDGGLEQQIVAEVRWAKPLPRRR